MKFIYPEGATPYNQDDAAALIPKHITTQKQLNEWEQDNIIVADRWLFNSKHKNLLSSAFIKTFHKKCLIKHGSRQVNLGHITQILGLIIH